MLKQVLRNGHYMTSLFLMYTVGHKRRATSVHIFVNYWPIFILCEPYFLNWCTFSSNALSSELK